MSHSHSHEHGSDYYVEQLCMILFCGLLGVVAILMWPTGMIGQLLTPKLYWTVLAGGIVLVILAALRGVAVWIAAGRRRVIDMPTHTHDHDHEHDGCEHHHHGDDAHDHTHEHVHHHHDHTHEHGVTAPHSHEHTHALTEAPDDVALPVLVPGHSHEHAEDGHTHDHDHGWAPWRYAVLMLPIALFFMGYPNGGPPTATVDFTGVGPEEKATVVADKGGPGAESRGTADRDSAPELGFRELEKAAYYADRRALYEGKTFKLKGQFSPGGSDQMFGLVRYKINCCAADAIPLSAIIMVDPKSGERLNVAQYRDKWVEVTGQVQFRERQRGNRTEWLTLILIRPDKDHPLSDWVQLIPPDPQPYI